MTSPRPRRRMLARLLGPAVLAAGGTVALPTAAYAADIPDASALSVVTMADDATGSAPRLWRTGVGSVEVTGSVAEGITVNLFDAGGAWSWLKFAAGDGETLTPGTTYPASDFSDTGPLLDASAHDYHCSRTVGSFTVIDVAADLSRLHIAYRASCATDGPGGRFGEVRVNVPGDGSGVVVTPSAVAWPALYPKKASGTVPVTLINTTAAPVTVTGATVSGSADFALKGTPCAKIPADGSCTVGVGFTASGVGERSGMLTITDSTAASPRTVPLSGSGFAGKTYFNAYGQQRSTESGRTFAYTPLNAAFSVLGSRGGLSVSVSGTDGEGRTLRFRPATGELLTAGATYTGAVEYHTGDDARPGIETDFSCSNSSGEFTVHELEEEAGRITSVSLTFTSRCYSTTGPALLGSVAWRAAATQPIPGIAGFAPDAPTNVVAAVTSWDTVKLTWDKPTTPDWSQVVVRGAKGTTAPATATSGFAVYTGTGRSVTHSGLEQDGVSYTFSVFVKDKEGKFSARTSVRADGAVVTMKLSRTSVPYWSEFTATGQLKSARTGGLLTGRKVALVGRTPGRNDWFRAASGSTDWKGRYSLSFAPAKTFEYWVSYDGSHTHLAADAGGLRVKVGMGVDVDQNLTVGRAGTTFQIGAVVGPLSAGKPVYLQRLVGGTWKTVQTGTLYKDKWTIFSVRPGKGTYKYRVFKPKQGAYAAGYSRTMTITVT